MMNDIVSNTKATMTTFLKIAGADSAAIRACDRGMDKFVEDKGTIDAPAVVEHMVLLLESMLGEEHRCVADALHILGVSCAGAGRLRDARLAHERAAEILTGTFGAKHPCVLEIREHIESIRELQAQPDLWYGNFWSKT